ncbi:MAG: hypothetical protein M5U14_02680 [Acidimicrobiia bacterium]|nr:hypothetical protein [Acidimicrobiia bacterium]
MSVPDAGATVGRVARRRRRRAGLAALALAGALATVAAIAWPSPAGEDRDRVVAGPPVGPQAEPPAEPEPLGVTSQGWTRIDRAEAGLGDGPFESVGDVTAGGPGFVAVGTRFGPTDQEHTPRIWTSPDGRRWSVVDPDALPRRVGGLGAVAAGRNVLLAVGSQGGERFVWRSEDGRAWREVSPEETDLSPDSGSGIGGVVGVRGIEATSLGLFAYGMADGPAGPEPAVWRTDGSTWERAFTSSSSGEVRHLVEGPSGLVAIVSADGISGEWDITEGDTTWFSTDGRDWAGGDLLGGAEGLHVDALASDGRSLVVAGQLEIGHAPRPSILWRSTDGGRSWIRLEGFDRHLPAAWVTSLSRAGDLWIASGTTLSTPGHADAWVSRDGDVWVPMPAELHDTPGGVLTTVAARGSVAVAMSSGELGWFYVWDPDDMAEGSAPEGTACPRGVHDPLARSGDPLPERSSVDLAHVRDVFLSGYRALLDHHGAVDARVVPRDGNVWVDGPGEEGHVERIAGFGITVVLDDLATCPDGPSFWNGVPVDAVVRD